MDTYSTSKGDDSVKESSFFFLYRVFDFYLVFPLEVFLTKKEFFYTSDKDGYGDDDGATTLLICTLTKVSLLSMSIRTRTYIFLINREISTKTISIYTYKRKAFRVSS